MLLAAFAFLAASMAVGLFGLRRAGYELIVSGVMVTLFAASFVLATIWFRAA